MVNLKSKSKVSVRVRVKVQNNIITPISLPLTKKKKKTVIQTRTSKEGGIPSVICNPPLEARCP